MKARDGHHARVAEGLRGGEVRDLGMILNRADYIIKLVGKLGKAADRSSFFSEAGPCSYGLHRQLTELGHDCVHAQAMGMYPARTPLLRPTHAARCEVQAEGSMLTFHSLGSSISGHPL